MVHLATDWDTVFALKLDKPFLSMVISVSNQSLKIRGGFWQKWCQRPNTNHEPIHRGDCSKPNEVKFHWSPKSGDYLSLTARYEQDVGEGDHMKIHPATTMWLL
jgi:hypothetical protein